MAPSGGTAIGASAPRKVAWMVASDWPFIGPSFQLMSSWLAASQAWPKVSAMIATPGGLGTTDPPAGMTTMSSTPGMPRTATRLLMLRTVPRICEGMRRIVGLAPGTSTSMVNFFLPVTMSRASSRPAGLPITLYCAGVFSTTVDGIGSVAASALSAP